LEEVRAAGGIVVRDGRVLLVHRPHYDDWGFPKGKAEPGESDEETARREVEEEACVRCDVGPLVGETRYHDSRGRPKTVAYFRMECDGEPRPGDKVDEVRWAGVDEALGLLSYERDVALLRDAAARGVVDPV
jgi:8-oxo-dGTP diphosphatase